MNFSKPALLSSSLTIVLAPFVSAPPKRCAERAASCMPRPHDIAGEPSPGPAGTLGPWQPDTEVSPVQCLRLVASSAPRQRAYARQRHASSRRSPVLAALVFPCAGQCGGAFLRGAVGAVSGERWYENTASALTSTNNRQAATHARSAAAASASGLPVPALGPELLASPGVLLHLLRRELAACHPPAVDLLLHVGELLVAPLLRALGGRGACRRIVDLGHAGDTTRSGPPAWPGRGPNVPATAHGAMRLGRSRPRERVVFAGGCRRRRHASFRWRGLLIRRSQVRVLPGELHESPTKAAFRGSRIV